MDIAELIFHFPVRIRVVLSVAGLTIAGKARQEVMLDSLVEDPSLEVGYEVLSDLGTSDEKTYVFEGRRLLLGV